MRHHLSCALSVFVCLGISSVPSLAQGRDAVDGQRPQQIAARQSDQGRWPQSWDRDQRPDPGPDQARHSGRTFVYVSSQPAGATQAVINAFVADPSGRLTPVAGSPFPANDNSLAVDRNKLYAVNQASPQIDGYAIAPDGALTYLASTHYPQFDPNGCGFAASVFPDRFGLNLYAGIFNADCANEAYQSYLVNPSGDLTYLGSVSSGASFFGTTQPLSFTANDQFGYAAVNNGCMYYKVWGFQRTALGDLNDAEPTTNLPPAPSGFSRYIADSAAASPASNLVAISMEPANPPGCSGAPIQIGVFTPDAQGNLSTTNTSDNMPATAIRSVFDMKIAPSGQWLAVGGQGGLQLFHLNGANPPAAGSGLLTTDTISQIFWDRHQNLYALSQFGGTLHVFTVTADGAQEAPGSPYAISQPLSLAVQSR